MHFCHQELIAIMSIIPFIGIFCKTLHVWYKAKFIQHKCHDLPHEDQDDPEEKKIVIGN